MLTFVGFSVSYPLALQLNEWLNIVDSASTADIRYSAAISIEEFLYKHDVIVFL